ncbi:hypothetical protein TEQG_07628 [Trichophyton equinum CBS 127.97]|uniref:HNH nuclease domain-containing protein n=1 Tax=Trichophyton equinum (strain ATCC MYA-4606 / CBS 127.97) TaxID=559882 RepID=F2Q3F0_TRIEC|nr:hypothetical protein TEQG_07628 [Trichophyton equinum CBS 127.97]
MAEAEFGSQRRVELINKIAAGAGGEIDQPLWPFLWLADIPQLEEISKQSYLATHLAGLAKRLEENQLLARWTQRTRERTPSPTPSLAPAVSRLSEMAVPGDRPDSPTSSGMGTPHTCSKEAVDLCRLRDSNRCVVTGADEPVEAAHIFPFSMRGLQAPDIVNKMYNPWSVLRMFWSQEKVDAWYNAITGPVATETVQNLMCLAPSVHKYHERAYFALEPVEEDTQSHTLTVVSGDEIISGTLINITGHEGIPLPDPALLQLQWMLQRIVALAGGAEVFQESSDDGDDDDYDDYPEVQRRR